MNNRFMLPVLSIGAVAIVTASVISNPASSPLIGIGSKLTTLVTEKSEDMSDADASRLAEQATFGPDVAVVARIRQLGVDGWLNEQFSMSTSTFNDLAALRVRNSFCDVSQPGNPYCFRIYRDSILPAMRFYRNAVDGGDQLRQRVALAFFNMMPVSGLKVSDTAAVASYLQLMHDNAFGNYSNLLRAVVMSGAMACYLDLAGSEKSAPNENLARELLQLFSIGPNALHANGVPRRDATGALVPNYSSKDVAEIARALTGWNYARLPDATARETVVSDRSQPLIADPSAFDPGEKSFLGIVIPSGASQQTNIDRIIKRLVNDPSTSPRISAMLIKALVKSNPSDAYIGRVSHYFRNNGSGVTGDLKAVVRAILTDPEARNPDLTAGSGKLKDPILLATSLARAVNMSTDGYAFTVRDVQMGQQFLRVPSIFGDYPSDFPLPGSSKVVSPSSKLLTVATAFERHNFVWQWTMSGDQLRAEFTTPAWIPAGTGSAENWTPWEAFGADTGGMIERINVLLLNGRITPDQRAALLKAMTLVTDANPTLQARRRAQTGLYIVASSPQFQVER